MKLFISTILLSLFALSCQSTTANKSNERQDTPNATLSNVAANTTNDTILKHCVYTATDSAKVVELLKLQPGHDDVLFYARKFKGVPYVASTLEKKNPEQLIINLKQLDCTTLVEKTLALTMPRRQGKSTFEAYCKNLETLRYWHGKMNGYLSRLHYFTWWMHDNIDKGLIEHVKDAVHFTAPMNVQNHYMSAPPDK